jgi:hypothetical protein
VRRAAWLALLLAGVAGCRSPALDGGVPHRRDRKRSRHPLAGRATTEEEQPCRSAARSVGAPGDAVDKEFLRTAVQIEVFEERARVVVAPEKADLVLGVLVGSMGLNIEGRFLGIEGTDGGGVIPFTIPELALFKRTRTSGFARAEFALVDLETGEIIRRSDPVEGRSEGESTTVLMVFSWDETDITPLPPPDGGIDLEP